MDDKHPHSGVVIPFAPSETPTARIEGRIKPKVQGCPHARVLVDQDERALVCRDCGCVLDALDWLLRLAVQREQLDTQHAAIRAQVLAEEAKARRLKRQNAKARQQLDKLVGELAEHRKQLKLEFGKGDGDYFKKLRESIA